MVDTTQLSRAYLIATLSLLLCLLALPTGAEPSTAPSQAITNAKRLKSLMGVEVRTREEESAGRIIDLLADSSGDVQAAVIEFGGFLGIGTRKIAVEWSALRLEAAGNHPIVILDVALDDLRLVPEYKPDALIVVRRVID